MSAVPLKDTLRASLDSLVAKGIVGASACVARPGQALVIATAGLADRERQIPVTPSHLFKIGSVTKSFVAVTLMRLAEEGIVSLDAPISAWFPQLPYADRITVRQLVNHRSGIPEFELHMPMSSSRRWTPRQIVDLAYSVRPPIEPGRGASYTNTGYVLAGMLIEALTSDSLASQIRKRILAPLGLRETFAPAGEPFPQDRLVHGYYYRPPLGPGFATLPFEKGGEMWQTGDDLNYSEALQDSTSLFSFTGAFAAGDMVSTAADLSVFIGGLFAGRLVRPETLQQMLGDRVPAQFLGTRMRESGAGLFVLEYADRQTFGHQGSMPGYVTVMAHEPRSGASAALTTNTGSGNRLHFFATGLHAAFDEVVALAADV